MSRLAEIQEKKGKLSQDDVLYLAQRENLPGVPDVRELADLVGGETELQEALYSNKGFGDKGERTEERRRRREEPTDLEDDDEPESDGVAMSPKDFPTDPAGRGDSTEEDDVVERTRDEAERIEAKKAAKESKKSKSKAKASDEDQS